MAKRDPRIGVLAAMALVPTFLQHNPYAGEAACHKQHWQRNGKRPAPKRR